jgi:pimeloyl-ACP methyl ester carboxylesterase
VDRPVTRYAWNREASLAYQVVGEGPVDLVYLQGFLSNVELNWEHPALARFLRELAGFSRLIVTDRRGLGCSERFTPTDTPPIEVLADDLLAVLDEAECDRPVVFATGDCGSIACPFAASHPDRLSALVLYGTVPAWKSADAPWGVTDEEAEAILLEVCHELDTTWWRFANPSSVGDERELDWALRYGRVSITPGGCYADGRRFNQTDIRGVLPSIQVPTLVLHRRDDPEQPIEAGRYLASHIQSARIVELPGADHMPWLGPQDAVLQEVRRFVTTVRKEETDLERVLATVLFTDIVASTEKEAALGDRGWRDLLERHHAVVRGLLARYRGTEIDTVGDGFFATFDGPARAVRCAQAIAAATEPLGLEIRSGLHTGEVETIDDKVTGIAVSIGARIGGMAGPSEVLVSQTVKDLVAGSGLVFEDRGEHDLKGVPDRWRVYQVVSD